MENFIVDFYHGDKVSSWSKMAKKSPFVIFKGTQRTDFVSSKLKEYINGCENHKIPYFIYAYLEKGNEEAQTKFLVKTTKDLAKEGRYFVGYCLDAEENNASSDILKALAVVKKAAEKNILYTMYDQYKVVREAVIGRGDNVAWWEARYGKNDGAYNEKYKPHSGVDLHQFTSEGVVDYMTNKVDLSRLTGTLPLEWFTDGNARLNGGSKEYYSGDVPKFPPRGYYKLNDGIKTYVGYSDEIKKLQKIVNWVMDEKLTVDGKYGKKTRAAVEVMQGLLKVKIDGLFGKETLTAALNVTK